MSVCSKTICMFVFVTALALSSVSLNAQSPQSKPLDEGPKVSGNWKYSKKSVTIGGIVYDSYGYYMIQDRFVSFDIRGWDRFTAYVGIDDNSKPKGTQQTSIEIDGNPIWQQEISPGAKATFVDIPLTGKSTLTLRWESSATRFAEPQLFKGNQPTQHICAACKENFRSQTELNDHIRAVHGSSNPTTTPPSETTNTNATFVVDPNDLEKLASNLRKRVDAKPEVKQKLSDGFMAVMTFNLIDIPSQSVAQNVAEDLSTRMINADFNLVERGQLDKALKELKVQNSGMIDPTTAKKIGQITGCNFILVGSISDRGQFIVMNARILETATGKAVAAESVECRKIEIKSR